MPPLARSPVQGPRNLCTHLTVARLFDPYGSFKCSICQKHPSIGWLYRCTQDSDGFLSESDFTSNVLPWDDNFGQNVATHSLSSHTIKAITQGHYTNDQIKTLVRLKEQVRDLAVSHPCAGNSRPPTGSTFTTTSSSSSSFSDRDCTFSTIPHSSTFSTTSSTSLDDEIKQAYDWKELQKVWMSEPSMTPPTSHPHSFSPSLPHGGALPRRPAAPSRTQQRCNFMVCPTCRPNFRDRAYQSLDDILNRPVQLPPVWDLQNRRVSDAQIVAQIGLRKTEPPRFYAQADPAALQSHDTIHGLVIDDTDGEVDYYDASLQEYLPYKTEGRVASTEDSFRNHEPREHDFEDMETVQSASRHRGGLRHTLRKVLTKSRREESTSTHSGNGNAKSSVEPRSQPRPQPRPRPSSSLLFLRRRSRSSMLSFAETPGARVVDTSPLQESVMLMVASNTPLPPTPGVSASSLDSGRDGNLAREATNCAENYFPPTHLITQA